MMKLLDNSSVTLFILEIPQYDFLKELYNLNESLNITQHVRKEFEDTGEIEKLDFYLSNEMIKLKEVNYDSKLKMRFPNLGNGELSIIQWGLDLKGKCSYQCILDDLLARKVAKRLGLSISGSIGLIILVKDKNKYTGDKIEDIIESIDKSNFRISKHVLNKLRG